VFATLKQIGHIQKRFENIPTALQIEANLNNIVKKTKKIALIPNSYVNLYHDKSYGHEKRMTLHFACTAAGFEQLLSVTKETLAYLENNNIRLTYPVWNIDVNRKLLENESDKKLANCKCVTVTISLSELDTVSKLIALKIFSEKAVHFN
jgi:hypothetical protein